MRCVSVQQRDRTVSELLFSATHQQYVDRDSTRQTANLFGTNSLRPLFSGIECYEMAVRYCERCQQITNSLVG